MRRKEEDEEGHVPKRRNAAAYLRLDDRETRADALAQVAVPVVASDAIHDVAVVVLVVAECQQVRVRKVGAKVGSLRVAANLGPAAAGVVEQEARALTQRHDDFRAARRRIASRRDKVVGVAGATEVPITGICVRETCHE